MVPPVAGSPEEDFAGPTDLALEQRKLASLERRARAVSRRMQSAEKRGIADPTRAERDRSQLETLVQEVRKKREELGLPSDWSPDDE